MGRDKEIEVIENVIKELGKLESADARNRALRYASERIMEDQDR